MEWRETDSIYSHYANEHSMKNICQLQHYFERDTFCECTNH